MRRFGVGQAPPGLGFSMVKANGSRLLTWVGSTPVEKKRTAHWKVAVCRFPIPRVPGAVFRALCKALLKPFAMLLQALGQTTQMAFTSVHAH